ncbi:MAG: hypothetical protein WCL39_10570 [Armatimonadota bacterium]
MKLAVGLFALLIAFVLQGQFADRLAPSADWRPDFLFAVVLLAALYLPGRSLPAIAFLGGMLEGVLLGMNFGGFIVSRLVAALVASLLVEPLQINTAVTFGVGVFAAAVGQLIFLLVQPTSEIVWWLNAAVRQSVLIGVLVTALAPLAAKICDSTLLDEV